MVFKNEGGQDQNPADINMDGWNFNKKLIRFFEN